MYIVLVIARNLGRISSVQSVCHPKLLPILFFFETGTASVVQASTELKYSAILETPGIATMLDYQISKGLAYAWIW